MATVALTASPTQLDAGTTYDLVVLNSGSSTVHVQVDSGNNFDQRLSPGQSVVVYPHGLAVTAYARSGSGQVTVTTQTNPQSPSAGSLLATLTGRLPVHVDAYGADPTGAADSTAAFQAAYDASPDVMCGPGTYKLGTSTSIFLDTADAKTQYRLTGVGRVELKVGTGCKSANTFVADPTAGWLFHMNTVRTALIGNQVQHSDANRATGSAYPPKPRLVTMGVIWNGQGNNVGLVYGNTCIPKMVNPVTVALKYGISWRGYADGCTVQDLEIFSPVSGGWFVYQTDNGDGISITCKSNDGGVWNAQLCNGGHVESIGGGYSFKNCRGITVKAAHPELYGPAYFAPFLSIDCSTVIVDGLMAYPSQVAGRYLIEINDSTADSAAHTDLILRDCVSMLLLDTNTTDAPREADLRITAMNLSSRVRVQHASGITFLRGNAPHERDSFLITSADAAIQTALTTARGLVASSDFVIRWKNGTWQVQPPSPLGDSVNESAMNTPTSLSLTTTVTLTNGTLTPAATYEYAVAVRDCLGNYTAVSAAASAAAPASGVLSLFMALREGPTMLVVWRKTGTGVLTAPDRYVEIPMDAVRTRLYDTGTYLNGRAWITTSVPVPNTVAASNKTFAKTLYFVDGRIEGRGNGSPEGVVTAPVGSRWMRLDGGANTTLYVKESGTGNTGWIAK